MSSHVKSHRIIPWEKGETAISQSRVYSRLPNNSTVVFYQSGDVERGEFIIEIACDVMDTKYFYKNYEKIMKEIEGDAKGRKVISFNN